jgi:hypothetical protein
MNLKPLNLKFPEQKPSIHIRSINIWTKKKSAANLETKKLFYRIKFLCHRINYGSKVIISLYPKNNIEVHRHQTSGFRSNLQTICETHTVLFRSRRGSFILIIFFKFLLPT